MDMSKDLVAASATPLVLAILAEGDSYGYAIIKRVTELSGGHLQWTDGMLYPVCTVLSAKAMSRRSGPPPRTAAGVSTTGSLEKAGRSSQPSGSSGRSWTVLCEASG
jgi:hypothetical protein